MTEDAEVLVSEADVSESYLCGVTGAAGDVG